MKYEITEQRKNYLDARNYTILTACPGSGKTTSIVYKLKELIEEMTKTYSLGIGVLCLSFTNKACDEIKFKYKEMHGTSIVYPNEVMTIDSFVTQYIVLKYWYLIDELAKPTIINEEKILHNLFFHRYNGKDAILSDLRKYGKLPHLYAPEKIEYLGNNMFKMESQKVSRNDGIKYEYCCDVLKIKLHLGVLNSMDALLIAVKILKKYPDVAKSLVNRFPYIILDEAQDTSQLQFDMIELLKEAGVKNIELVGDVNLSIYEWRNAKPKLFLEYSRKADWKHLNLMENRRSVQRIIDLYSRLTPKGYPKIVSYQVNDAKIPIEIIRYDEGQEKIAIDRFCEISNTYGLNSRLVLVRGKTDLVKLSAIKSRIEPWKSKLPYEIIDAQLLYAQNKIKEALRKINWACARIICGEEHFEDVKNYINDNKDRVDYRIILMQILKSLPPLSSSFNEWDEQVRTLLKEKLEIPDNINFEFKKKMSGECMRDLKSQPVSNYYGQIVENTIMPQTIHSVKGASVDAVLLFLHDQPGAQVISFKDIPNNANGLDNILEKHRLIYVACSRAKQFLALAVPSSITENQIKQRLSGLECHISSYGVQTSLNLI